MARLTRIVVPGVAHHVTQRGNRRSDVFFSDNDYKLYLKLLQEYNKTYRLKIWAYCLMSNHIHMIIVPESEESLAKSLRAAHTRLALYINRAQGWSGHLWQNRYFSCPLDDSHLWVAIKYVELNPVRAGIVKNAEDYAWSSAKAHIRKQADPVLSMDCPLIETIVDWQEWLREGVPSELITDIRKSTKTGRPLGNEDFVIRIEKSLSRILRPKKRGRPKNE